MWMTQYVMAVKRGFRDQHGITPTGGTADDPTYEEIPDGVYPMTIDGETDYVMVKDNRLSMCNFKPKTTCSQ
jgi:hypothetical protein